MSDSPATPQVTAEGTRRPWRRRHPFAFWGIVAFGVAGVAILSLFAFIALNPVYPVTVSGTVFVPGNCMYCPPSSWHYEYLPVGSTVSVQWYEQRGYTVTFSISTPYGTLICSQTAPSGDCTFISAGGSYGITPRAPVNPTEQAYYVNFSMNFDAPLF